MINVMIAGNYKVIDGMIIACLSLIKHCHSPIRLFVLTMDLQYQNEEFKPITIKQCNQLEKILKRGNENSIVTRIDFTESYKREMENSVNAENRYTPYALLRLYSDLMEEIPDKVIYIDTDVVINKDISELYEIDVSSVELAGVKDYYGHIFISKNYLNSGVLLLNMKRIRETGMFKEARYMVATKKMLFADQDAINKLSKEKIILPYKFNEQHKLKDDTVIRHFSKTLKFFPYFDTQNIKPWMVDQVQNILHIHEFDDVLDEYQQLKGEFKYE